MSIKKKYLIELYLKCSKYIYTAKENLTANENFLKASYQSISNEDFQKVIDKYGISYFTESAISIIDSTFSETEIQSLIDFFCSPVGRKMTDKGYILKISKVINNITTERDVELSKIEKE